MTSAKGLSHFAASRMRSCARNWARGVSQEAISVETPPIRDKAEAAVRIAVSIYTSIAAAEAIGSTSENCAAKLAKRKCKIDGPDHGHGKEPGPDD
jgi:hypothetical protein